MKDITITHECRSGFMVTFCTGTGRGDAIICLPGLRDECTFCPRNPEVPCMAEARMEIILSDFRKSDKGKKWEAEKRDMFLRETVLGIEPELPDDTESWLERQEKE